MAELSPIPIAHSVTEIEHGLAHLWGRTSHEGSDGERHVAARSSVLNLVVIAGRPETAERCAATIEATAGRHPSRSLIIAALDTEGRPGLDATIKTFRGPAGSAASTRVGAETIYMTVYGQAANHLASIIVPLLVPELPVALWWPGDPNFDSHRAERLLPMVERLIVDGSSWSGNGLERLAAMSSLAERMDLVPVDFALLRQARWREALASVYDHPDLRKHLRSIRSIAVEYASSDAGDASGLTNMVRPLYHVAWLASRLDMSVVEPLTRHPDGRRTALLRQGNHLVLAEWRPVVKGAPGSTVQVEITSRTQGDELVGQVTAGDTMVDVVIYERGRERVRRSFLGPRLHDVDLLMRAVEDSAGDPVSGPALTMAGRILGSQPPRGERRASSAAGV